MKLQLFGVRGSTPSPGPDFVRVGGHTACVGVWPEGSPRPRLLLDAGTGIRAVSDVLGGSPFDGTILLTHLHWDHVQGLPFFGAGDRADACVRVLMPGEGGPQADAAAQLARAMSPPHFPIGPDGLQGNWTFSSIDEGEHHVEGLRVTARDVPHKGGRTFGYRVDDAGGSFAYVPDHRPASGGPPRRRVVELVRGVDVLIHDAQFVSAESDVAEAYGHATVEEAIALASDAAVGRLVLFHHAPLRTDADLDALVATVGAPAGVAVELGVQGALLDLRDATKVSCGSVAPAV